jgi:hypothetical protein
MTTQMTHDKDRDRSRRGKRLGMPTPLRRPSVSDLPALAWRIGFKDGWESPRHLSMGMTWENSEEANEAYDQGANWGQRLRRLVLV